MTEAEIGAGGAGALGAWAFLRWVVTMWMTIQREKIAASRETAIADRDANIRMTDRQVAAIDRVSATVSDHTVRDIAAQADVKEAIVRVEAKVDSALGRRKRTRLRTGPEGHPAR